MSNLVYLSPNTEEPLMTALRSLRETCTIFSK